MPVTLVGLGTRATNTNGNVTPQLPAGLQDGDLLLMVGASSAYNRTWTNAAWSSTFYARGTFTSSVVVFSAWKKYAPGDGDPLFSIGGTSQAGRGVIAQIAAFRGADADAGPTYGSPYDSGNSSQQPTGPIPGVSVSGDGLAVAIAAVPWEWSQAPDPPDASWTELTTQNMTAATTDVSFGAFMKELIDAASGSVSIMQYPAKTNIYNAGFQIAIHEGITSQEFQDTLVAGASAAASFGGSVIPPLSGLLSASSSAALAVAGQQFSIRQATLPASAGAALAVSGSRATQASISAGATGGAVVGPLRTAQDGLSAAAVALLSVAAVRSRVSVLAAGAVGDVSFQSSPQAGLAMSALSALAVGGYGAEPAGLSAAAVGALAVAGVRTRLGVLSAAATATAAVVGVRTQLATLAAGATGAVAVRTSPQGVWVVQAVSAATVAGLAAESAVISAGAVSGAVLGALYQRQAVLAAAGVSGAAIGSMRGLFGLLVAGAVGTLTPNTGKAAVLAVRATPALTIPTVRFVFFRTLSMHAVPALSVGAIIVPDYHPHRKVLSVLLGGGYGSEILDDGLRLAVLADAPAGALLLPGRVGATIVRTGSRT